MRCRTLQYGTGRAWYRELMESQTTRQPVGSDQESPIYWCNHEYMYTDETDQMTCDNRKERVTLRVITMT